MTAVNKIEAAEARGYQKAIDALRAEAARALERFTEAHSDSPKWDAYVSTACIHGLHDQCRRVCKYGDEPCLCGCGHGGAPSVHEGGTARD